MDASLVWTIVGSLAGIVGVIATALVYKLTTKRPKVFFDSPGNGVLSRCLIPPLFQEGWGIVSVWGKLRVSHRQVTIVDAQLRYKMDLAHVRESSKCMGESFPPVFKFERVANDAQASTVSLPRQAFNTIKLVPGEGEKEYTGHFTLGGNFATEYSADFFGRRFSTVHDMMIPMMIRFEYEHNGHFYWTPDFEVLVYPFSNKGWTSQGPKYINDKGEIEDVVYSSPVFGSNA